MCVLKNIVKAKTECVYKVVNNGVSLYLINILHKIEEPHNILDTQLSLSKYEIY